MYTWDKSPEKKEIYTILVNLKQKIEEIQNRPDKIMMVVKLFQIISPLCDEGIVERVYNSLNKKKYRDADDKLKALKVLKSYCYDFSRGSEMNHSAKGEPIIADDIFLGGISGVFTNSVYFWLRGQKNTEKNSQEEYSKWPEVIFNQAKEFVDSHVSGILEQITLLLG